MGYNIVEPVTEAWRLRAGIMATVWGAWIVVSPKVEPGCVIFCDTDNPNDRRYAKIKMKYDDQSSYGKPAKAVVDDKLDEILSILKNAN